MTTPAPDEWLHIATIEDEAALQLLKRFIEADATMLEARLVQLRELQGAVDDRIKNLRRNKRGKQ